MATHVVEIPPTLADERRRCRRIRISIPVELHADNFPQVARLTELSRNGARLQVARPIRAGKRITIRRSEAALEGFVVWCRGDAAGVRFPEPMGEVAFLKLRRGA